MREHSENSWPRFTHFARSATTRGMRTRRMNKLLTQPYDKISPAMQDKYYAADPHNLITVEKGRAYPTDTPQNNVYTRAAAALQDWIGKRVVTQDPEPAFYGYTQEYTVPGTQERRTRRGFIGAGKLEEYSAGVVFRHEQRYLVRKRTGWRCCGTRGRILGNYSCCIRTLSGRGQNFGERLKQRRSGNGNARRVRRGASLVDVCGAGSSGGDSGGHGRAEAGDR